MFTLFKAVKFEDANKFVNCYVNFSKLYVNTTQLIVFIYLLMDFKIHDLILENPPCMHFPGFREI